MSCRIGMLAASTALPIKVLTADLLVQYNVTGVAELLELFDDPPDIGAMTCNVTVVHSLLM